MYNSSLSVFMTNNMPSGVKRHHKSAEPESHQTAKVCFLSSYSASSSSSDWLVQIQTLSQWFFTAFYTEQCTSPSLFN